MTSAENSLLPVETFVSPYYEAKSYHAAYAHANAAIPGAATLYQA